MSGRLLVLFFYLLFNQISFGGVAPNPFLRPGSGKVKAPPTATKPPPPISQEVVKEVNLEVFFSREFLTFVSLTRRQILESGFGYRKKPTNLSRQNLSI